MKITLDCMPCFVRQALEAARVVSDDPAFHENCVRNLLKEASTLDLLMSPPILGQELHRRVRKTSGIADPYYQLKRSFNSLVLKLLPEIHEQVQAADDPFAMALRYAIVGNVIDMGAYGRLSEKDAHQAIDQTMSEPFFGDIETFRNEIEKAQRILYLTDNAGEIVFDRLFIEQLPMDRVTVAVRGKAILNDALMEDAQEAGITDLVEVIDNGSDVPGTHLDDCSQDFRDRFEAADVIISKGQGNFETLSDIGDDRVFFLFKVKCHVVADHCGHPEGTQMLLRCQM